MVKLNKIYTRTGDDGTTGLVDGSRVAKHDAIMQAVGDVDEANSAIGMAVAALGDCDEAALLRRIQNDLFDLGADLATPVTEGADPEWALRITPGQVERLEAEIDRLNEALPALDSFILPGGSAAAAAVHLARAITRRAERSVVAASQARTLNPPARTYLNRLSDLLFVLARHVNATPALGGQGDIKWVPGASR
ncbi:cob(I)yrinic acid a,c-diamide adenosyltransferase [Sphingobium sp. DEHP117]|uniref:cob(I)yrinic acid a,c-diamide adenosyltransferase n=1 Tax=Sphingobium sp. DEHP117 TaxID=2993436 RepID=UPI0027D49A9B|nr:cob(I)yrinic acid a,c-diamide adenosyltransferase [Sphingobium sp. DEHP117]MDQ4420502.1 cob(I)yrinic acid a,c-diamide adenosyltransferase [Sphingobium sp. DEHP117]